MTQGTVFKRLVVDSPTSSTGMNTTPFLRLLISSRVVQLQPFSNCRIVFVGKVPKNLRIEP